MDLTSKFKQWIESRDYVLGLSIVKETNSVPANQLPFYESNADNPSDLQKNMLTSEIERAYRIHSQKKPVAAKKDSLKPTIIVSKGNSKSAANNLGKPAKNSKERTNAMLRLEWASLSVIEKAYFGNNEKAFAEKKKLFGQAAETRTTMRALHEKMKLQDDGDDKEETVQKLTALEEKEKAFYNAIDDFTELSTTPPTEDDLATLKKKRSNLGTSISKLKRKDTRTAKQEKSLQDKLAVRDELDAKIEAANNK